MSEVKPLDGSNGTEPAASANAATAAPTEPAARTALRHQLRVANAAAWDRPVVKSGSLDTSLKRHTAFIKRLRTGLNAADAVPALTKETSALSLAKYLEEIVGAMAEGVTKCKNANEVFGAIEVISALHARFPEVFSKPFTATVIASLKPPNKASIALLSAEQREKEESARIARQRTALRVLGELEAAAIVRSDDGNSDGEQTLAALKDLLTADKEALALVAPLAVAFTRHLGHIYLPGNSSEGHQLIPSAQQDKFRKLLTAYYDALARRSVKDRQTLMETERRNHEAYIKSGEIFEDRAQAYEKAVKSWDKQWASVQSLSESLGLPLPDLPSLPAQASVLGGSVLNAFAGGNEEFGSGSRWTDEEEKRFYEDLIDLRNEVPASVLGLTGGPNDVTSPASPVVDLPTEAKSPPIGADADADEDDDAEESAVIKAAAAEAEAEPMAAAPMAQLTALFARLPEFVSRESIDKAAVDFAQINSKGARKRMIRFLAAVPKTRQDLLPYYARLAATLSRYMPDISTGLIAILDEEFRYLQRKKKAEMRDMRPRNLRYISELTKFGLMPVHAILHIVKVCVDDFTGHNISNTCILLENCGRYLLRTESTRVKAAELLEVVKRKRAAQNLDGRYVAMIDNAYYAANPPDRPAIPPKDYRPIELYIKHICYNSLNRLNVDETMETIRSMDWDDPLVYRKLRNVFTKVWKIRYSNIQLLALILHGLIRYRSAFVTDVVDQVLEDVRTGLEQNNFKRNQHRVATVRYLGELYNYRVVDPKVVFDTLWLLVTFGHPPGGPRPDVISPIDAPTDFFRIRLICTLIDATSQYLDAGQSRRKLDHFLTFFQLYILAKAPRPMDSEFMVTDLFDAIRPKLVLMEAYDEAVEAVNLMLATQASTASGGQNNAVDSTTENEDGRLPEADVAAEIEEDGESEDAEEDDDSDSDETVGEESDGTATAGYDSEEDIAPRGSALSREEEDEFARELAKLMSDTPSGSGAASKAPAARLDIGVPRTHQSTAVPKDERHMAFTLLGKRGKARTVDVPIESELAVGSRARQEEAKAEQQQLKKLVLAYERREDEERRSNWQADAAKRGIQIKFKPSAPSQPG